MNGRRFRAVAVVLSVLAALAYGGGGKAGERSAPRNGGIRLTHDVSRAAVETPSLTAAAQDGARPSHRKAAQLASAYGQIPLHFEKNAGQFDSSVDYLTRGNGYNLFLRADEMILNLETARREPADTAHKVPAQQRPVSIRSRLVGARQNAAAAGHDPLPAKSNYFIGNDPSQWRTDVPNVGRVTYDDVWPGIDVTYYGNQRQLEYDFVVAPGADPAQVRIAFEGVEKASLDVAGNLILQTAAGEVVQQAPIIYQDLAGQRHKVAGRFVIAEDTQIAFEIGTYNKSAALVIDPVLLLYSTYLGGNHIDRGTAITVDAAGNAYVTGSTLSTNFPMLGPYQSTAPSAPGTYDVFVAKLSPSGNALVYSTYLGGSMSENTSKIIVQGDTAYVAGYTSSPNFPTASAFQTDQGGDDAFVTRLSSAGNALIYSTYVGGAGFESASSMAIDETGAAFITGQTNSADFPTVNPYQASKGSGGIQHDAYLTKIAANGASLVYSTYLGGSSEDGASGVAVDAAGRALIVGWTQSTNFPHQATIGTGRDSFLTKFATDGQSLLYSTLFGPGGTLGSTHLAVDSDGSAHISAYTSNAGFPTVNAIQPAIAGISDAIVAKFSTDGTSMVYATYLGGSGTDQALDIDVDASGSAYIVGGTASTDFPLLDSYQTRLGPSDAFVVKVSATGQLVYSTLIGGGADDSASAVAVDNAGNAYIVGGTTSTNFPTQNPFQGDQTGTYPDDAFVAKVKHVWSFSVGDVAEAEGNSASHQMSFTVTLDDVACCPASVEWSTADGSALAGQDYQAAGGSLAFVQGDVSKTISVTVFGDPAIEPDERFYINLSNATGAQIRRGTATAAILDDDGALPHILVTDITIEEGDAGTKTTALPVRLSSARGVPVQVNYQTGDSTAMAPGDYTAGSGTITFAPWTTETSVPLTTVGDMAPEPRETLSLTLSSPVAATISDPVGIAAINDDDSTSSATGNLAADRNEHTTTLLADGRVLALSDGSADVYDPQTRTWSRASAPVVVRTQHTAAATPDGRVIVAGGWLGSALSDVQVYDPIANTWTAAPPLTEARAGATANTLDDGRVIIIGGTSGATHPASVDLYTPVADGFGKTSAAPLTASRTNHSATRLSNGKILVAAGLNGSGALASAYLYDPALNSWTETGSLSAARHSHTATALADGRVLVAGGISSTSALLDSTEVYDPSSGIWSAAASLNVARARSAAALLPDGDVVLAGGDGPLRSYEIYSSSSGSWAVGGDLRIARRGATATLLAGGSVLVVGGSSDQGYTAELLDLDAGVTRSAGSMNAARAGHTSTLLADGRVVSIGGGDAGYEVFDRATGAAGSWSRTALPEASRAGHAATLLPSGAVLVSGGTMGAAPVSSTGLLIPGSPWDAVNPMSVARSGHTATLLDDGRVLVAGGISSTSTMSAAAELFDATTGNWTAAGTPAQLRCGHTASRLHSGEVLLVGGSNLPDGTGYLRSAEIYRPLSPPATSWRDAGAPIVRRSGHVAVVLKDGRVVVAGGRSGSGILSHAEVYDPRADVWTEVAPMAHPREHATATLLWNGNVLVAGGRDESGPRADVEIWDPSGNRWVTTGWGLPGRFRHTATMLATGEILFAAGTGAAPESSAALLDPTGIESPQRPEITSFTPFVHGNELQIEGNRLRRSSESGSGDSQSSATDLPGIEVRSLETSRIVPLTRADVQQSPNRVTVSELPVLDAGWYHLRLSTAGVPSTSRIVSVGCSVSITSITGPGAAVPIGQPATFVVNAQGARRYQWQQCTSGACEQESEWSSISGATLDSYTTPPVAGLDSGTRFRVIVNGNCASATSAAMVLTVADSSFPSASVIAPSGGEYWLLSSSDQPPNTRVVTWSMSDDVRLCQVSTSLEYSDDGGTTYVTAPGGGGLPATFGSGAGCVSPGVTTASLSYTVPTTFPSGHSGSLYRIRVAITDQAGNTTSVTSANPFHIVQANPDSVKTLILSNVARMVSRQGISNEEAMTIRSKLNELANHPRVQGLVVDLDSVTSLGALYATWDADPSNPGNANAVLFGNGGIHHHLRTNVLPAYTGVKYLVLVGDDRIIPMARMQDRTTLLPEQLYTDLSPTSTTVGRAIAAGKYLSDDPLSVLDEVAPAELDGSLFVPDLAIGRLVETPQEIVTTIATYIGQDGILDLSQLDPSTGHKVLVTGYDFLSNVSRQIRRRWKRALGVSTTDTSTTPVDGGLIGGNWGLGSVELRTSALRTRMAGNGGERYGIMAISGHATHYEEGVPGNDPFDIQGLSTADIYGTDACATSTEGAIDLSGGIVYAVGCHGGLSVPGSCATDENNSLDLPQTMLARGAVAYIANSGFGWALKRGIGYGARLTQILTEQMTVAGTITIGDAVRSTKQRYSLEAIRPDSYDEKSSMQWTLYGLPMYAVRTGITGASGLRAETKSSGDTEMVGAVRVRRAMKGAAETARLRVASDALPASLTQLSLAFDFTGPDVYTKYDSAGEALPPGPGCADPSGCYYTLNGLVDRGSGASDLPIQPYLIYDSRLSGSSQHGVLWKGGTYDEESGWTPVIAELVSNGGDGSNHGSTPRTIILRPTAPRVVPGPDSPSCQPSDLEMNSLTVAAGEAVKGSDESYSITRRYRNVDLEVFYFNDRNTPTNNCDRTGPSLGAGPFGSAYHQVSGSSVSWSVPATDPSGMWRVLIVYTRNTVDGQGRGKWVPLELANDGSGVFTGNVSLSGTSRVTYVIQAVDNRGNVTWLDYVTSQLPSSGTTHGIPETKEVDLAAPITAPANVVAAAVSTTSVSLTWNAVGSATSYDVYRSASGTGYAKIGSSAVATYTDNTVNAGTAYLYSVKAIDAAANASDYSNPDLATTVLFTDPTITAGVTTIKAAHISELRAAVNAVRILAGEGAYPYVDSTITAGVTRPKSAHITDLRSAIAAARTSLDLSPAVYSGSAPDPGLPIRAVHITELRRATQ